MGRVQDNAKSGIMGRVRLWAVGLWEEWDYGQSRIMGRVIWEE